MMDWETCEYCKPVIERSKDLHVEAGGLSDPQYQRVNQEERKKLQAQLDGHRCEVGHGAT